MLATLSVLRTLARAPKRLVSCGRCQRSALTRGAVSLSPNVLLCILSSTFICVALQNRVGRPSAFSLLHLCDALNRRVFPFVLSPFCRSPDYFGASQPPKPFHPFFPQEGAPSNGQGRMAVSFVACSILCYKSVCHRPPAGSSPSAPCHCFFSMRPACESLKEGQAR